MNAERKKIVNKHKVEEFYWNGKMVVYVDNVLTEKKYDEIKEQIMKIPNLKLYDKEGTEINIEGKLADGKHHINGDVWIKDGEIVGMQNAIIEAKE